MGYYILKRTLKTKAFPKIIDYKISLKDAKDSARELSKKTGQRYIIVRKQGQYTPKARYISYYP